MKLPWAQRRRRQQVQSGSPAKRPWSYRPLLQELEDRTLLSGAGALSPQLAQNYGQIPLSFEANQGQTAAQIQFLSRGSGYTLFLASQEAVLSLNAQATTGKGAGTTDVLQMQLVGASTAGTGTGLGLQASVSNYLLGNDPSQWHTNVPN